MKRKTLTAIAIAAVLIVAGLALCVVSVDMGAQPKELFSNGTFTFDIDDFELDFDRNGISGGKNDANIGSWPSMEETVIDVDKIVINWLSGKVSIEGADVNEVSFSESANKALDEDSALVYRIENGTLYIDYCREKNVVSIFGGGYDLPSKDIVITVPQSFGSIRVETVSANVEVRALYINSLDLSTTSGELTAESVYATNVELTSVSGNILFGGSAKEFDAETTSGELSVEFGKLPDDFDVETVSGNVSLTLPADSSFELEFETVSGDLDCEFEVLMYDGDYVAGNGGAEISVSTVSGDCSVKKK